jgi:hypothetical protein
MSDRAAQTQVNADALKLWRHVFGGERGLLQVWTGIRGEHGGIPRESIKAAFFNYPQAAEAAADYAYEKAAEGREAFFCAHLLSGSRRIKENAGAVVCLWGDLDGAPIPNGKFKPTAVVESSPGRYHAYWRLTDAVPGEAAERLNARLAHETGADRSGFDLTQLLRVPGTPNNKYEGRPLVGVLGLEGGRSYSPAELDRLLPQPQKPGVRHEPDDADEPPVVLSPEALKVWRGDKPKCKPNGETDRSATLLAIARVLFGAGANKRPLVAALAERDRTLGYEKYTGNRDGGRKEYERIFSKLGERNSRGRVTVGEEKRKEPEVNPTEVAWPKMEALTYRGLFGRVVELAEEHTEGDPVALLASAFTAFGSAVGRGPFMQIGATRHHPNIFCGIVGDTAKGRKGSTWDPVENVMHASDRRWAEDRIQSGLSSGESLISEVRDPVEARDKDGKMKVMDGGVSDKRLLVQEGELSQALKVMKREGNTLSPVLRNAWDGKTLKTMVKHSPLRATAPHVCILGHITTGELVKHLSETEMANGLANRIVWMLVKRSKSLPFGDEWHTVNLQPVSKEIVGALEFASGDYRMTWADDARPLWAEAYDALTADRPGMFGAVTARAEAQTLRLSMLYALADCSFGIRRTHVESALAVWEYAEESARYIFGDAIGDADADKVLEELKGCEEGMTRTEVRDLFGRNRSGEELDRIMGVLTQAGRVRVTKHRENGSKKPVERWYAA